MPRSILDAIQSGDWQYEPVEVHADQFDQTDAMPGSNEKVAILAERLRTGLPLWHPCDREDAETPAVVKPR